MVKSFNKTIAQVFDEAVEKHGNKECVIYPEIGLRWTCS